MFHPLSLFHRYRRAPASCGRVSADPYYRLQEDMTQFFDDACASFGIAPSFAGALALRVDVRETEDAFEVEADLPGVAEDDLDVQIVDKILTISGEKRSETSDEKKGAYRYVERSFGSFSRSIPLPFGIDPDAVDAVFKNGVLKLTLPKPPGAAPKSRKIVIKRG